MLPLADLEVPRTVLCPKCPPSDLIKAVQDVGAEPTQLFREAQDSSGKWPNDNAAMRIHDRRSQLAPDLLSATGRWLPDAHETLGHVGHVNFRSQVKLDFPDRRQGRQGRHRGEHVGSRETRRGDRGDRGRPFGCACHLLSPGCLLSNRQFSSVSPLSPLSHSGKQADQIEENSSVAVKSASPNCSASLSIPGRTESPNNMSAQS